MPRRYSGSNLRLILSTALAAAALLLAVPAAAQSPTQGTYDWQLPRGFPLPKAPPDNPMSRAKVALGCRLFFDTQLSIGGQVSCASCHDPERAFTDGRRQSVGATGASVRRNSMSLANVVYAPALTWASDSTRTLEQQMAEPMFGEHPVEMGMLGRDASILQKLADDDSYATAFRAAFPSERTSVSMVNLIKAIAAYERSLISGDSPFDRYVYRDEQAALSAQAKRGMSVFFAKDSCADCHSGIAFSGPIVHAAQPDTLAVFASNGLYDIDGDGGYPATDRGLIEKTGRPEDMGKFRIPTLRNIALTAPYMHDGSMATLQAVITHYAARGPGRTPHVGHDSRSKGSTSKRVTPHTTLTDQDQQDLLAFLHSLTDESLAQRSLAPCR